MEICVSLFSKSVTNIIVYTKYLRGGLKKKGGGVKILWGGAARFSDASGNNSFFNENNIEIIDGHQ